MRRKCTFFSFKKKTHHLPFFYPLQSLVIFCMLKILRKCQLWSSVPAQHSSDRETWSPRVPTAVCWSLDGERCALAFNSALWVTSTFFLLPRHTTATIKVLSLLFQGLTFCPSSVPVLGAWFSPGTVQTLSTVDQALCVFRSRPLVRLHRWLWDSILWMKADFSASTAEPTPSKSHLCVNARLT